MGGRKLLVKIEKELRKQGVTIGRDRFFRFLKEEGLLVKRRRRKPYTTDSRHGLPTYPNKFKQRSFTAPNQAWVSDITYIRTQDGFAYLSLITDAYSRKIVGYNISNNMKAKGPMQALRMAFRQLPSGAPGPIHHSDRGSQYCSKDYIKLLESRGCKISMTEDNHCYENAMAERVNGILKYEYGLKETFLNKKYARIACRQAIRLYTTDRPHMALNMATPQEVHCGIPVTWKMGVVIDRKSVNF